MAKRNNKKAKQIILLMIIILVVLLVALVFVFRNSNSGSQTDFEKANIEYIEKANQKVVEDLSDKPEQERIQYYCANFFKLIDTKRYEDAYKLLYSEYKENFFPTFNNFKKYFEDYFPDDFGLSYLNIERFGDIYVLTVNLNDTVNGKYGHNFQLYVVIKENKLNDYVISFSRNSAVEDEGV